ncbi:hypothetical protein [Pseudoxanthomonas sp. z9]|uniref:alpha/beta hydrolase n=1 Tax=Pseudoxanthomonas sp. z9 TaxID=2584942 RepID=UPI0011420900|nr:hypothetical protein [Pseudoxanthomonas sp. z9]
MRIWGKLGAVALGVLLLVGCRTIPDREWWGLNEPAPVQTGLQSQMMVFEADDRGQLYQPAQMQKMAQWMAATPTRPVVLFVHGWHHNACRQQAGEPACKGGGPYDSNYQKFTAFLARLENVEKAGPVNAIYVGWRGDSIDTFIPWEPSDFLTIRDRKHASEQVGKQGLREVVAWLRTQDPKRQVFVIGHSLGGSAVLWAVKEWMEDAPDTTLEYIMINPAARAEELEKIKARLEEKARSRQAFSGRQVSMATALRAAPDGSRRIIVLQSTADVPVRYLFPFAFWKRAIGFNRDWVSHSVRACSGDACTVTEPDCQLSLGGRMMIEAIGTGEQCQEQARKAVWVMQTGKDVSAGHNDVLNDVQAAALADWLAQRMAQFRVMEADKR